MTDPKDALDALPVFQKAPCADCGATDWRSCNINSENQFYECDRCCEYDPKTDKKIRKNLQ